MDIKKIVGRNLRRIRTLQQVSIEEVARILEMPKQNISAMELGKRAVTDPNLVKFAEFYCVNLSEFFVTTEEEQHGIGYLLAAAIMKMNDAEKALLYAYILSDKAYRQIGEDRRSPSKIDPDPTSAYGKAGNQ